MSQYQPQGYQQQLAPGPQPGVAGRMQQDALQNSFMQAAGEPVRQRMVRERIDDGKHAVYVLEAGMEASKNPANRGQLFLRIKFRVVSSTVQAAVNREYTYVLFLKNEYQIRDLSDMLKQLFGEQQVIGWAQQGYNFTDLAMYFAQQVVGKWCLLETYRANKEGTTYETAFINHLWGKFVSEQPALPVSTVGSPPMGMPQGFPQPQMQPAPQPQMQQALPPQMPQGFPQSQMQQAPQPQMQQALPPQMPQGFPQSQMQQAPPPQMQQAPPPQMQQAPQVMPMPAFMGQQGGLPPLPGRPPQGQPGMPWQAHQEPPF